jgi:hypothetical protein
LVCFIPVKKTINSFSIFITKKKIFFREIFYITEECLILAKFFSYLPNSLLRIINNDTYEEMPLVFNRLAPGILTKNKVNDLIFYKKLNSIFFFFEINSMVIHFLRKEYH